MTTVVWYYQQQQQEIDVIQILFNKLYNWIQNVEIQAIQTSIIYELKCKWVNELQYLMLRLSRRRFASSRFVSFRLDKDLVSANRSVLNQNS